jgi:hypothetical protein
MPSELQRLARAVLARSQAKKRDSAWDSRGTVARQVSQRLKIAGTAKTEINQGKDPSVPLSHALGLGQWDSQQISRTPPGTVAGQYDHVATDHAAMMAQAEYDANPYASALAALRARCPAYIDATDWQQAIEDGRRFVTHWGEQAEALGWVSADLFGLHTPPENLAPNYRRLSRYDQTGLIWLLRGRPVIALTSTEAIIRCHSGATLKFYRRTETAPATAALEATP